MSIKRIREALQWLQADNAALGNEAMQADYIAALGEAEALERVNREQEAALILLEMWGDKEGVQKAKRAAVSIMDHVYGKVTK